MTADSDWSPIRVCECGMNVRDYHGTPGPWLRGCHAYNVPTGSRHRCVKVIPQATLHVECFCGKDVYKYADGTKLNRPDGTPHTCTTRVEPPIPIIPRRVPIRPPVAPNTVIRGVIDVGLPTTDP